MPIHQYHFLNTNIDRLILITVLKIKAIYDNLTSFDLDEEVQGNVIFQIPIYHLLHADEISIQALAVRNSFKFCYMALISLWPVDVSVDTEGEVRGQIWRDIINPYTTFSIYVDNKHHTYSYGLVLRFFCQLLTNISLRWPWRTQWMEA